MNKNCFRLVFSKPLGFLIPVAELTTAQRKPGQTPGFSPASRLPSAPPGWPLKPLTLSLMLAYLPSWATAQMLVDPNSPGGTNVVSAANGVPVIEIAAPNSNGLSHNRFTEFDVQQPGVIYNNSLVNGHSQLGGAVLLNPNLTQSAKAILTEVTGNNPSTLRGTLEVFGDRADLLIAEPTSMKTK